MATSTASAATTPLPTSLGGATLAINGRLAPLFYASPTQINAQLPNEIGPGEATAVVTVGAVSSTARTFTVTAVHLRPRGWTAIAVASAAGSGNRRDDAGARDEPDPVVNRVRDIQVTGSVHSHATGSFQLGAYGWPAVAGAAWGAGSGNGSDDAVAGDSADAMLERIRNVEVAGAVDGHALGRTQSRLHGGAAVPGGDRTTIPGNSGDDAVGGNHPDAIVEFVGDVEVAVGVRGHTGRLMQLRARGWAAIAGKAWGAVSSDWVDNAQGGDDPDVMIELVRDVEIAGGVHRHADGQVQSGARGRCRHRRQSSVCRSRRRW